MLIQPQLHLQKLSRFVKHYIRADLSWNLSFHTASILTMMTICVLSSCQSTIRFSSKTSSHEANTTLSSKSRASSSPSSASGTSSGTSRGRTTPQHPVILPQEHLNETQERIVTAAERWLGTPYRYGATTRAGTDCSGFVMRVFEESGTGKLPRSTKDQFSMGAPVERELLRTGDLLFFNTNGVGVSHVGLYVGEDSVIHASSTYGVVKQSFSGTYLTRAFIGARRVLGGME